MVFSSTTFGAYKDGPQWFAGEMDEFAIWDVVKTASEIAELYNSEDGKFYDP